MSPDHVAGRRQVLDALRADLVGPCPAGPELECSEPVIFSERQEAYGPFRQAGSGEEILITELPTIRYGVGVLFPIGVEVERDSENPSPSDEQPDEEESRHKELPVGGNWSHDDKDADADEVDLTFANVTRSSVMGISFLAHLDSSSGFRVKVFGGRYEPLPVNIEGGSRVWWLRRPVTIDYRMSKGALEAEKTEVDLDNTVGPNGLGPLQLQLQVQSRIYGASERLITVSLINRTPKTTGLDESCLFQAEVTVEPDGANRIVAYPGTELGHDGGDEEESLRLLYRDFQTFATGHGCSADWDLSTDKTAASKIMATSLPAIELPSLTPDVFDDNDKPLEISMKNLAALDEDDDGVASLGQLVQLYKAWIQQTVDKVSQLEPRYTPAAHRHILLHRRCLDRIESGIAFLKRNAHALLAFQLANHAVLLQQIRAVPSERRSREITHDRDRKRNDFSRPPLEPDPTSPPRGKGVWRPFQIAFILSCVESVAKQEHPDRETVDLIWFPTGGGKTEAYLGLSAFSIFLDRLEHPGDTGVHVVMRYTLRLLSAQQFERASSLVCAMEHLRKPRKQDLGTTPISIGLWVGTGLTPNSRDIAKTELDKAKKKGDSAPPFALNRCPWCAASFGPVNVGGQPVTGKIDRFPGYQKRGKSVVLVCPDRTCEFHEKSGLPIYVIDEDIYEQRPTILIGTADKFARLAWVPKARAIFGLSDDGNRVVPPPNIIIQDELHLISGPLGSMVGLYEAVIEDLCTDHRCDPPLKPKLVCSTATIRRYPEQVMGLYGREKTALFPPPGTSIDNSFFARFAREDDGSLSPGRLYVGVHAPALRSMQTAQVRTMASLLQAPMAMPIAERDPWWTVMTFFSSLRELGTTLSLLQSDIPNRLKTLHNRYGPSHERRWINNPQELTSRLVANQLEQKMDALETRHGTDTRAVDVCLATSMIEVGLDIDRLSLMVVTGQPKSTSQYIQVTGRVGRSWWERPGLIVTILGPTRPRDRSHFEQFRAYHQRFYAHVEPTSVTPFSTPAMERAIHAAMIAYVRQHMPIPRFSPNHDHPFPYPESLVDGFRCLMQKRVATVDPKAMPEFTDILDRREGEWRGWEPRHWEEQGKDGSSSHLMVQRGGYVPPEYVDTTWSVQNSMRDVDAECQVQISRHYMRDGAGADA